MTVVLLLADPVVVGVGDGVVAGGGGGGGSCGSPADPGLACWCWACWC